MNIQEANLQDIISFYFEGTGASNAASALLEAINNSEKKWLERMLRHHGEKHVCDRIEIKFRDAVDDLIVCFNVLEVSITGGLIPIPDINSRFWFDIRASFSKTNM